MYTSLVGENFPEENQPKYFFGQFQQRVSLCKYRRILIDFAMILQYHKVELLTRDKLKLEWSKSKQQRLR